ncbi:MAG: molybdopterin-dependent oxidoreductase [Proteobacteria bacterium]|nr:molybdopterin-dependent oxidoreductase [Pseudomonadota bacterium]
MVSDDRHSTLKIVGKSIRRVGALERALGEAKFSDDFLVDGTAHLKILRSREHHARIKAVDGEETLKLPGVVRVFTARDIPGRNRVGPITKDQPVLAEDKVRFIGDPIALIAAETEDLAEEALRTVKVDYEAIESILTPERALEEDAPKIHENGNLLARRVVTKGDIRRGFQEADMIVDQTYTTSRVEQAYLETDAGFAYIDDVGRIVLHVSTQNPHYDQAEVASVLGLDLDRIRVIQSATGGGFGSKLDVSVQCYLGLAAFHLQRPVKLVYTREEVFTATSKRHPLKIHYKTGATEEGKLTAIDARILGDTGAYASYGATVATRVVVHATGPYEVPHFRAESIMVYTNNTWAGAMRGFGIPQLAFAHESQMDMMAERLGMDPIDFRLKNVLREGSSTGTGQILQASVGIGKTLEQLKEWRDGKGDDEFSRTGRHEGGRVARGVGVASMWYGIGNTGIANPSTAQIEIDRQGNVVLFTGTADIGQGSDTVLLQIAAEELGVEPETIRLIRADTAQTTNAGATSASRQTYISGNAVRIACMNLKEILFREAREHVDNWEGDLFLEGGNIFSREVPEMSIPLADVAARAHREGRTLRGEGFFDPETTKLDLETGQGNPYGTYAFASHLAEVEVDGETGEVTVRRIIAAHDVGKAINPMNVIGQINSGVAMGLGLALTEAFVPGETNSFLNYFVPTIKDIPEIVPIIVEDEEPTGPFGAKGIGEPALIPTAPAILNAIADALGARIHDLPASLERVRKSVQ